MDYEQLKQFAATKPQQAVISALMDGCTHEQAAKRLGCSRPTVTQSLATVRKKAALRGVAPEAGMNSPTPLGYHIRGTSRLEDADGNTKIKWIKEDKDKQLELELAQQVYAEMSKDVKRLAPMKMPKGCDKKLLNLYPITDLHIGMMSWHKESGRDWDLKIAERTVRDAFRRMVVRSDKAESCIIGQLGDFLHFDGLLPITPAHGHVLDADGRFSKVVAAAIRIQRALIDEALQHHKLCHVITCEGNHDPASSVWMQQLLAALYENEPRVTIDDSASPYYVRQHGTTFLGFHHGHLKQEKALPGLFATEESKMWGATEFRYAHTGHRHSTYETTDESGGMTITRHPTLASRDAYASRHGFTSMSNVSSTTYHTERGKWSGVTVTP
tara:strand:- start:15120 stop:16274 length:1155 start_codon:yes stop_codon:yes gene_type:complete